MSFTVNISAIILTIIVIACLILFLKLKNFVFKILFTIVGIVWLIRMTPIILDFLTKVV